MCVRLVGGTIVMVNTVVSGPSGPGLNPGRGHFVVFLGKTLYYHCDPFHLCVQLGSANLLLGEPCYTPLMCLLCF